MNKRRPRSDDVLFISALSALLLGVALLLYTTGTFGGTGRPWPFLIMAAGGFLLYLALVREFSFSILFVGIIFVLEGALVLVRPSFAIYGVPSTFNSSAVGGTLALGVAVPF